MSFRGLNLACLAAVALFLLLPGLDVRVSTLFYLPGHSFPLAGAPMYEIVRQSFRWTGNLSGVVGLALMLVWLLLGPERKVPARLWGYLFAVMAIGPGALVNLVVKPLWGRARPANVELFGGPHHFTPFYLPTDQCVWGCSFVSGEAAGATGLAIVLGVLLWPSFGPSGRRWLVAVLAGLALAASLLRVAMGRHFLSDITFGAFLSAYTALALYRVMGIAEVQPKMTRANLAADLRRLAGRLRGR